MMEWKSFKDVLPPDNEIVVVWNTKYNEPKFGKRKGKFFHIRGSRVKMSDQSHWIKLEKPQDTDSA